MSKSLADNKQTNPFTTRGQMEVCIAATGSTRAFDVGTPGDVLTAGADGMPVWAGSPGGVAFSAQGQLVYGTGSGSSDFLAIGTNGQYLTSNGTTPQWSMLTSAAGDLVYGATATGLPTQLPIGTAGQFLVVDGTGLPAWQSSAPAGSVPSGNANDIISLLVSGTSFQANGSLIAGAYESGKVTLTGGSYNALFACDDSEVGAVTITCAGNDNFFGGTTFNASATYGSNTFLIGSKSINIAGDSASQFCGSLGSQWNGTLAGKANGVLFSSEGNGTNKNNFTFATTSDNNLAMCVGKSSTSSDNPDWVFNGHKTVLAGIAASSFGSITLSGEAVFIAGSDITSGTSLAGTNVFVGGSDMNVTGTTISGTRVAHIASYGIQTLTGLSCGVFACGGTTGCNISATQSGAFASAFQNTNATQPTFSGLRQSIVSTFFTSSGLIASSAVNELIAASQIIALSSSGTGRAVISSNPTALTQTVGGNSFIAASDGTLTVSGTRCGLMAVTGTSSSTHNNNMVVCSSSRVSTAANTLEADNMTVGGAAVTSDAAVKVFVQDDPIDIEDPQTFVSRFMNVKPKRYRLKKFGETMHGFDADEMALQFPEIVKSTFHETYVMHRASAMDPWEFASAELQADAESIAVLSQAEVEVDDSDSLVGYVYREKPRAVKCINIMGLIRTLWAVNQKQTAQIVALRQRITAGGL